MRQNDRRTRSLHGVAVLVALAACSPEAITSGGLDRTTVPVASVERADTGSIAREKWLLRLAGQEAAETDPNRWFSLRPENVHAIGASRALLTPPQGPSALLTDDDRPPNELRGATNVSLAASNIFVLTMFTAQAYSLEGDGSYDVYYNRKAAGGVSYRTWAYDAALVSQSVNMSISGSATDTIEVNARSQHRVRHQPYATMEDSYYLNVVSFGHDRHAPALTPPKPIEYETSGNGPDGAPDGEVACWFHYRSYDGGRTWYLLRVSCPDVAGKYRGLAPAGALRSNSSADAPRGASSTSGTPPAKPATFVVLGQERLEDGQRAVVYLRPGMSPEAVIAIDRKNARPSDIAEGVAAMMQLRSDGGSREEGGFFRTTVMKTTKIPRAMVASGQNRFGGYLSAMKHAPLVNVPGVGSGNAVEVQMPTGH